MSLPYFPLYRDDWRSSTAIQSMSLEQEGAYIRLLTHMWGFRGGCWLPDDADLLTKLLGVNSVKYAQLRYTLIDGPTGVFQSDGQRITNARLTAEWDKACRKSAMASSAVQSRYTRSTDVGTDVERTYNERTTDAPTNDVPPRDCRYQIPEESNTTPFSPPKKRQAVDPTEEPLRPVFEVFWEEYPRSVNKVGAWKRFCTCVGERNETTGGKVSADDLVAAARNYATECRQKKQVTDYIKHPTTFLSKKDRHFEEYITAPPQIARAASAQIPPPVRDEDITSEFIGAGDYAAIAGGAEDEVPF